MGTPDPPWPPQLVGEVLRTGRIPNNIVGYFPARFRVTGEEGGGLYIQSLGQGKGFTPSSVISPPGWTHTQVWSALTC